MRDWSNPHVTSWFTNHYVAAYAAVDWSSLRSQAEHSIAWLKGGTALIESLIDLHFDYHAVKLPLGSLERQTKMQTFVVSSRMTLRTTVGRRQSPDSISFVQVR